MRKIIINLIIFSLWMFGCARVEPSDKVKEEVLKTDPAFKPVLDKKIKVDVQIGNLRLRNKIELQTLDAQIRNLFMQKQTKKKQLETELQQLKSQLNSERRVIRQRLDEVNRQLQEKRARLNNINNIIFNTRQLREKEKNPAEQKKRQQELDENNKVAERLNAEIKTLKEQVNLYTTELNLLRH